MSRWAGPLRRVRRGPADSSAHPSAHSSAGVSGAEVVYARILDGEHLWLAVRTPAEAVELWAADGDADGDAIRVGVPTVPDGDLVTARVPLAQLPSEADLLLVVDGRPAVYAGEQDQGPLTAPPSRDGRWQYAVEVADDATVRVRRTSRAPEATLVHAVVDGDELVLTLDVPGDLERSLLLGTDDHQNGPRPIRPDGTVRLSPDALEDRPGSLVTLAVGTAERHVDVRRSRNALRFPGAAVLLPGLTTPGVEEPSPSLRWLRDGRLALARPDGPGAARQPTHEAGT